MPKISVIIPVYKVEKHINRCLESVINQSFTDFDVIVIDDGSPDRAGEICDEYAERDDRLHVIHQKNRGLSAARNRGIEWAIKNSDSNWITFIDSDDWIEARYLDKLLKSAEDNQVDISVCEYDVVDDRGSVLSHHKLKKELFKTEEFWCLDQLNATIAWGKLYRKTLFADIRFPIGKIHEDSFTTYKVLFLCDNISLVRESLYYYYLSTSSISRDEWSPRRLDNLEAHREQISYFKTNNYTEALLKEIQIYISQAYSAILFMKNDTTQYDSYIKREKKELAKILLRYYDLISFFGYDVHYNLAFGKAGCIFFKLYWYVKNKIKQLRGVK